MKIASACVRRYGCLFAIAWALSPTLAAQESGVQSTGKPVREESFFKVVPLKHVAAVDVAKALQELFDKSIRLTADPTTNSLLLHADKAKLAEVDQLLLKLDAPKPDTNIGRMRLRSITLRSLAADKFLESALRLATRNTGAEFVLDQRRNMVVINADEETYRQMALIIEALEHRALPKLDQAARVRILWLLDGAAVKDGQSALPADLKEVRASLAKLGFSDPRLAAQAVVSVSQNSEFQLSGTAKLEKPCLLIATGVYGTDGDSASLNITIRATRDQVELAHLRTTILAPMGHYLVLGVTPTDSVSSVFVVQILPQDPK